jgi:uncharacterized repeat protein (TIGR04076 family)
MDTPKSSPINDTFTLYDLRIEVVGDPQRFVCHHRAGDFFELKGEEVFLPAGQSFTLYALAAIFPLLPAKQRPTHPNDWMTTDAEIGCPDPHCGARFRIIRVQEHLFTHAETSVVPLA